MEPNTIGSPVFTSYILIVITEFSNKSFKSDLSFFPSSINSSFNGGYVAPCRIKKFIYYKYTYQLEYANPFPELYNSDTSVDVNSLAHIAT